MGRGNDLKTLILSVIDIQSILQHVGLDSAMDQITARLTEAIGGYIDTCYEIPVRDGFDYSDPVPGLIEWMPIKDSSKATIKVVGYHPGNPMARGIPSILSTISAYDTSTGHLIGITDATLLTALRTGAASAVATRILASQDASVLGLIGCGAQAVTQLHAISRVIPLETVLLHDIDQKQIDSFQARCACLNLNLNIAQSPLDELTSRADILCTATSVDVGAGPVFKDQSLKPWLHINAVGSDFPGKTEVPLSVLERSLVCPDFPAQACKEGECQQLDPGRIGASLTRLVKHSRDYALHRSSITVFDSTGWALEDQLTMEWFMDYAKELKLGKQVEIESITGDPHNPYEFLIPLNEVKKLFVQ